MRLQSMRWLSGGSVALTVIGMASAVTLKPKSFPLNVLGVQADIPVTATFDAKSEGDILALQLAAEANLSDLQAKALEIARALPVPRGNCDRVGINPVVNSIDAASITPNGDTAVVALAGHVTAWGCIKPGGITMKTEGPRDSVSVTATIRLVVIDGKQIGVRLAGPVSVKTGSALTAEAVRLFAGDIETSITNALAHALDTEQARAKLPSLPGLDGSIQDAAFAGDGSTLLIRAHANARMTGDAFNSLLDTMR